MKRRLAAPARAELVQRSALLRRRACFSVIYLPPRDEARAHAMGRCGVLAAARFLDSGPAARVLEEAGLDGDSQYRAVRRHLDRG